MKKTFATAAVAAAAAGVLLTGAPAHASGSSTSGDASIAGGSQTQIPVAVNTSICGNNILNIAAHANAFCKGNAKSYQN
ncbi:hypothetical protein NOGI109294_20195 [Nocardiopsis gilva]|uniref:hypothetical protein n=1 Tax=Nocardiopsis gilva TaxID=280236 RepID=UPI0003777EF3|nr:hypothetical protein [Nocardiopsis gilva]